MNPITQMDGTMFMSATKFVFGHTAAGRLKKEWEKRYPGKDYPIELKLLLGEEIRKMTLYLVYVARMYRSKRDVYFIDEAFRNYIARSATLGKAESPNDPRVKFLRTLRTATPSRIQEVITIPIPTFKEPWLGF